MSGRGLHSSVVPGRDGAVNVSRGGWGNALPAEHAPQDGDKLGPTHILPYAEAAVGIALHKAVGSRLLNDLGRPGGVRVRIGPGYGGEGGTGKCNESRQKGGDKTAFLFAHVNLLCNCKAYGSCLL
ncbi:hypothetical protein SDC9_186312 [bioreactor metagenome]|uniref:Uncharacterized protein n=1 Tax=bioreactor metagenome TaxID=1076179 RepID=A0A645HIK3_9ZZZZ